MSPSRYSLKCSNFFKGSAAVLSSWVPALTEFRNLQTMKLLPEVIDQPELKFPRQCLAESSKMELSSPLGPFSSHSVSCSDLRYWRCENLLPIGKPAEQFQGTIAPASIAAPFANLETFSERAASQFVQQALFGDSSPFLLRHEWLTRPSEEEAEDIWEAPGVESSDGGYECGRGDKRTKKGKIFKHSHGKSRPTKSKRNRLLREQFEITGILPGQPLVPCSITPKKDKEQPETS